MTTDNADLDLNAELRLLEEQISDLREQAAEIRRRLGDRSDGPTDDMERATTLTQAEEQEAFIGELEARREVLLERLGKR